MKDKLRILNLEDSVDDAELNQRMISARWPKCELVRVDTQAEFMWALEKGGFDLILSDYSMPRFDGRQALTLAHERWPDIPFLFVSGTIGEDAAIEALKQGATDYVLKHRLMRLIPAVDRALREAEERAECERAETAMRNSEYKYRELFESLGEPAFLAEESSGRIIDANRAAEAVLGCTRADILGRKESSILKLDKTSSRDGLSGTDPRTVPNCQCELVRADGESVPMKLHTTRLTLYESTQPATSSNLTVVHSEGQTHYGHTLVLRLCHEISDRMRKTEPSGGI